MSDETKRDPPELYALVDLLEHVAALGELVAAKEVARRFLQTHNLVSLAPGQIVIDGEPAGWMHAKGPLTGSWGMLCSLTREQALPDDVPVYFGPVQEADND